MSAPTEPNLDALRRVVTAINRGKKAQRRAMRRLVGPWADFLLAMEQIHGPDGSPDVESTSKIAKAAGGSAALTEKHKNELQDD
jgi:hypothetical protein